MEKTTRIYSMIASCLFMIFLSFPMIYQAFDNTEQPSVSLSENRTLAARPVFDITYLDKFPGEYTSFYDDHFPFRDEVITYYGKKILYGVFGKSPVPGKVDIGSDGWLFQAENRGIYSGQKDFSPKEIEVIYQILSRRAQFLAGQGIEFYIVIPPMKCDVYSDVLPSYYKRDPEGTRTDKLIQRIKQDSLIRFVDVRDALKQAKDSIKVYEKTDNHLSSAGGFIVYREVMKHLSKTHLNLTILPSTDLIPIIDSAFCGGLTKMARLDPDVSEIRSHYIVKNPRTYLVKEKKYSSPPGFSYPEEYEIRHHVPDSLLPSIMIIRDSFTNQIKEYLSESFNNTLLIWDNWEYGLDTAMVIQEQPDIVLLEVCEPLVHHLLGLP